MQGWRYEVYSWWRQCTYSNCDANVFLCMLWCECPLGSMLWCECPLVGMLWWECLLGSMLMMRMPLWWCAMMLMSHWCMPWCEYPLGVFHDVNVHVGMSWCKCSCRYVMTRNALVQTQFIQKFLLFSKRYFFSAWNQNILKTRFIIHEKSSSFWLKAPKKMVITVKKSLNGAFTWNLMIWLKRLIFTIWLSKEMARFQGLFLEKRIL